MEPVTAAATAPWWAPAVVGGAIGLGSGLISSGLSMWEGDKNRDFQRNMSNTAHQRQMLDMQRAGLNPALSGKYGGASQPSGGQANITMPDIVNSAVSMASAGAQIKDTNAAAQLKEAQTLDTLKTLPPRLRLLAEQRALTAGQGMVLQPQIDEYKTLRGKIRSDAAHSALDLNRAESESKFYEDAGQFSPYINFLKQLIGVFPEPRGRR